MSTFVVRFRQDGNVRLHLGLFASLALILAPFAFPLSARAQGSTDGLTVLKTDSTTALHSQSFSFLIPTTSADALLQIKFGFATEEVHQPGKFFDALTLTLSADDGSVHLVLVTVDASGSVFAPLTPGTTVFSEGLLHRSEINSPILDPLLPKQIAYSIDTSFQSLGLVGGKKATLYVDLFDNNDDKTSLGWISDLTVVPEPAVWQLGLTSVLLGLGFSLRSFRRSR